MNILVLEDRGSVAFYVAELLEKLGHSVFIASNIYQAQDYFEDTQIDGIIADLDMSPEGLDEEEIQETQYGLLTGWVWLNNHVFKKNTNLKKKTIIYSDYVDVLKSSVDERLLEGISLEPKSHRQNEPSRLFEYVTKLSNI